MKSLLAIAVIFVGVTLLAVTAPVVKSFHDGDPALTFEPYAALAYDAASYDPVVIKSIDRKGPESDAGLPGDGLKDALSGLNRKDSYAPSLAPAVGPVIMNDPRKKSGKDKNDGSFFSNLDDESLDNLESDLLNDFSEQQSWGWLADEVLSSDNAPSKKTSVTREDLDRREDSERFFR